MQSRTTLTTKADVGLSLWLDEAEEAALELLVNSGTRTGFRTDIQYHEIQHISHVIQGIGAIRAVDVVPARFRKSKRLKNATIADILRLLPVMACVAMGTGQPQTVLG